MQGGKKLSSDVLLDDIMQSKNIIKKGKELAST